MVVLPTTFSLEVGKDAEHQVRASAKSGLGSLTWMRVGLDEPPRTTIRIPVHIGIMRLLPAVKLLESMTTNSSADLKYTSKRPSMSQAFHRSSILSGTS